MGNRFNGVFLFASSNNIIGGTSRASRNLISGNDGAGVFIEGGGRFGFPSANDNEVRGNLIGTQRDGIKPLGNGAEGVDVIGEDADGNSILSNSVFSNGGLGMDLGENGPTANDGDNPNTPQVDPDSDTGPNDLQNKPSLGSAKTVSGTTTIKGTLNSSPADTYIVQFFSNPSGTDDGRTFIGQKADVTVDPQTGKGSFTFTPSKAVPVGQTKTATATKEFTGDTSELSGTRTVASS